MAAQMQHMIRQNAQKMQDTLADLYDWCAPLPSVPAAAVSRGYFAARAIACAGRNALP